MTSHSKGLNKEKVIRLIGPDGLVSQTLKGFESRPQQQRMMGNVIDAYNDNQIALIEAGTGTGKSLAYLVPALIWASLKQERTVISTHTIALQEQLFQKDIPALIDALKLTLKVALAKGMHNYLCLRKLEDAESESRLLSSEEMAEIEKIQVWSTQPHDGSRSSLPFTVSHATWDRLAAESEACSHQECPYYQECHFFKARKEANDAQILVVNHSLLFSDIMKRAETNNYSDVAVLPPYKRIILDEAHHIEEISTEFLAAKVHQLELIRLLNKLSIDKMNHAPGRLPILKSKLQSHCNVQPRDSIRKFILTLDAEIPAKRHLIYEQMDRTFETLNRFILHSSGSSKDDLENPNENKLRLLDHHLKTPQWKEEVVPTVRKLLSSLKDYTVTVSNLEKEISYLSDEKIVEQTKSIRLDIQGLCNRLEKGTQTLEHFLTKELNPSNVRWMESQRLKTSTNLHLVDAELDIAGSLSRHLFSKFSSIVLCSATLASNNGFEFMRKRLGLIPELMHDRTITENRYDSPFDYQKQVLLLVPSDIPSPLESQFQKEAFQNILTSVEASHGNAFVLFTSYQMLENCHRILSPQLEKKGFPVLKQGDGPRHILLNKFKETERSVLFGTDSFWEGIDVAGDALRCVIIVKLPFKVPTEPLIQARMESIQAKGGNPFMDYSIPQAIVKFKQGFGRLIRNKWDRGCIVCLDTRLITKSYGKLFINSLPNCNKIFAPSSKLKEEMEQFYRQTYYLVKNNPVHSK